MRARAAPHRRLAGWIAILSILLATMAPSLGHALGAASGATWFEVCTSQGSKWVASETDEPPRPGAAHAFEHCPVCSVQLPPLGAPPAPLAALRLAPLRPGLPPADAAAPRPWPAGASALPRAPPRRA